MNERIQELGRKAGAHISEPNDWGMIDFDTSKINLAKFAELIVKECINCCDEVDRINKAFIQDYDYDPQNGPKECIQVIKKHFGVE